MVAAVGSWLDARANRGKWLLRIDDLDAPRVAAGSIDSIQRTLEAHGLHWDDSIVFQSRRFESYADALEQLTQAGKTFSCACTRKDLMAFDIYPGTCKHREDVPPRTIRLDVPDTNIEWYDRGLGFRSFKLVKSIGDFPLRNAHGIYSYHLANVVDDIAFGVSHVVRGADLEQSTAAHLHLQSELGGSPIVYYHLPLALDASGVKLSKQTAASPVDNRHPQHTLNDVYSHLGMHPVPGASTEEVLESGIAQWKSMHPTIG
jgi:glutamyl-Q tRNA(Asp) synthetase